MGAWQETVEEIKIFILLFFILLFLYISIFKSNDYFQKHSFVSQAKNDY